MPPASESVIDGLSLGGCDFRWDNRDIVGLCGLCDCLGIVDRRGVVELRGDWSVLANAVWLLAQ